LKNCGVRGRRTGKVGPLEKKAFEGALGPADSAFEKKHKQTELKRAGRGGSKYRKQIRKRKNMAGAKRNHATR